MTITEIKNQIIDEIKKDYVILPKAIPVNQRPDSFIEMVMQHVSICTGVSVKEMQGVCRTGGKVRARMYVSHLSRSLGGLSLNLETIGKHLHRDHTTVMHHIRRFKEESSYNKELAKEERSIREGFIKEYGHFFNLA